MDVYAKTQNHRKSQKQKSTDNQENTKYRKISYMEAQFLHLACQGCRVTPPPPVPSHTPAPRAESHPRPRQQRHRQLLQHKTTRPENRKKIWRKKITEILKNCVLFFKTQLRLNFRKLLSSDSSQILYCFFCQQM